jgi:hypothetical protein
MLLRRDGMHDIRNAKISMCVQLLMSLRVSFHLSLCTPHFGRESYQDETTVQLADAQVKSKFMGVVPLQKRGFLPKSIAKLVIEFWHVYPSLGGILAECMNFQRHHGRSKVARLRDVQGKSQYCKVSRIHF